MMIAVNQAPDADGQAELKCRAESAASSNFGRTLRYKLGDGVSIR